MKPEDKIYLAYFKSKKSALYYNEIKRLSGLSSDSSLTNTLNRLIKGNVLKEEKTRSNTYYRIKNKKTFSLKFSEIAMQKFEGLSLGIRSPLGNFLKNIPKDVHAVVLFGSASRKDEQEGSDIDVLIVSDKKHDFEKPKKEANSVSNYPINVFECTAKQFIKNDDPVIVQARETGCPIYKEQNFYEAMLDEY